MKKAKLFNLIFCTFLCIGWSVAQNASLSGMVKDTDGTALFNVKVVIDGTGKGAITDYWARRRLLRNWLHCWLHGR